MTMDFTQNSCREFVTVLASNAPVPGGGGAAERPAPPRPTECRKSGGDRSSGKEESHERDPGGVPFVFDG